MLYLMRHGESSVNLTKTFSFRYVDEPLTETGRGQAQQAAEWLASQSIRRIYSSPLQRSVQTAAIIGRRLGRAYAVVDDLHEIDVGPLEGRNDLEAWQVFRNVVMRWIGGDLSASVDGGETGYGAVERFSRFIDRLPAGDENVLIVGHGGIFAAGMLSLCTNLDPATHDFGLANTGVILVDRRPDGLFCVQWDLHAHLTQPPISGMPEEVAFDDDEA